MINFRLNHHLLPHKTKTQLARSKTWAWRY